VVWMGAPGSMEAKLVPARGYAMAWVNFSGLRGKGLLAMRLLPLRLLRAFWQSAAAIRRERPDVVLGMGGTIERMHPNKDKYLQMLKDLSASLKPPA
jgi:UDP-N-acetylglucosamine--N-acetylmuramyl-(pentapeptide) pyrophosphoryl-undecaprenol N-acetylglucosamine transferase